LISLVLLLILTLIAIQQVSDPKRVGRVATAIGLLPTSQTSSVPKGDDIATSSEEQSAPPQSADDQTTDAQANETLEMSLFSSDPAIERLSQMLGHLLRSAPAAVISQLATQEWFSTEAAIPTRPMDERVSQDQVEWFADSKNQLHRWIELSDSLSEDHAALSNLRSFLESIEESMVLGTSIPRDMSPVATAYRLALDRTLLNQFSDNTPWRTEDRVPLLRSTQRAIKIADAIQSGVLVPEILPAIAVPQLMGDTDVLRGKAVRVWGRIALVDTIASLTTADPRLQEYRVLWLQPDDGSNQPIIVHVPATLKIPESLLMKDQSILVSGIITKRRAYASQRGGEIAPVIVAAHVGPMKRSSDAPPVELSAIQKSMISRWNAPQSTIAWTPPVDVAGAMLRIEQRIGSRLPALVERVTTSQWSEDGGIETLAHDSVTQAILTGLNQVITDVILAANANTTSSDTKATQILSVSGIVTKVRTIPIAEPPFPGWSWKELYALNLSPFESSFPTESPSPTDRPASVQTVVLTQHIPALWKSATTIRQPVVIHGLSVAPPTESGPRLMISPSVDWRQPIAQVSIDATTNQGAKQAVSWLPTLPAGWQSLLQRGWNLGWIDLLEGLQGQPMSGRESEAFYEMLHASTRSPATDELSVPTDVLSVMESIQRAEKRKAARSAKGVVDPSSSGLASSSGYFIEGIVQIRRVQRIEVRDSKEQEWLGSDHYFQLDGFADIGRSRITIRYDEIAEPIIFEKEFPVTLVAVRLPDSMFVDADNRTAGESQAWYPRARMEVAGWFYRMWRFKTTQVSEATGDKEAQQGPLLVVRQFSDPPPLEIANASQASPFWVTALTSIIGGVGVLWILYQIRRGLVPRRR
jgi:hypothetical protein